MKQTNLIHEFIPTNHYKERTLPITHIIIHSTALSLEEQLKVMDETGLSVHYMITKDAKVYQFLEPEKVAYHAGLSCWQQSPEPSLNATSIGIEIEAPTLGQNKRDFHVAIMKKLTRLLKELTHTYKIRIENILGHSDIAPQRKADPGLAFPWKKLYQSSLGVWYKRQSKLKTDNEEELLNIIGYDTRDLTAARYAFCRHFLPEEIFVEPDIKKLLNTPYPSHFTPKDPENYLKTLKSVAYAYQEERQARYWYLER